MAGSEFHTEDEFESHQSQRRLALTTMDELTQTKLLLLDSGREVPKFLNYAISYLNRKYLTEEKVISDLIVRRESGG
ncbi:hypothetical protein CH373_13470 [Leptospira perolatii]|uniref:Uncharacterized protein n=1 Tax=Leptospira perolatii TaxID=2023191 RepID=A0A2M9ZKW6_9LEPT|nr:hypothetical protein [Leptospira perolatii]PJZ69885.1 hypothetical protein CH360_08215 [Leptospira perolatii]PJZ72707.1 hypothetical protein CH373_13470 [Leptospira perolatii]